MSEINVIRLIDSNMKCLRAGGSGWATAPDGPYTWGYCFVNEIGGQGKYYGRGPIQLTK